MNRILVFLLLITYNINYAQPCLPVTSENFESGFGNWVDGGLYCDLSSNAACEGTLSVRIRNKHIPWSTLISPAFDMTGYDSLRIEYKALADNLNIVSPGNLKVQMSENGAPFSTLFSQVFPTQNTCPQISIAINSGNFGPNTKIRFLGNLGPSEYVFIDNIVLTRCGGPANQCFDGIKNGNETGIDCGGICSTCLCNGNITTLDMVMVDVTEHYGEYIDTQIGGSISNNASVCFTAGDSIILRPNFEIALGASATFVIDQCKN